MTSFAIIGGDKRNIALAELLVQQGHDVKIFGFAEQERELPMQCKNFENVIRGAQYIIGATPCSHNGIVFNAPFHGEPIYIDELFGMVEPHQVFIAGHVTANLWKAAKRHNVRLIDMLEREELLTLNAIPTAEGALKIAIEETDFTLHGSNILVIGYGRIGTVLCRMLAGIGANVTVVVNSAKAFAQAKSAFHTPVYFSEMNEFLHNTDVVYNTVPSTVLDSTNMHFLKSNTLIIDLASPPYGVDVIAGRDLGLKILFSSSLPGKVAPATTAAYMLDTIWEIIRGLSQ